MRGLILICLAAASPCVAQPSSPSSWITGERLVQLLGNVDPATVLWTSNSPFRTQADAAAYQDMTNREFVRGYIRAVHDATDGKEWCSKKGHKPLAHELEADVRQALPRLPVAELQQNAADLIVKVWKRTWPCPAGRPRTQ